MPGNDLHEKSLLILVKDCRLELVHAERCRNNIGLQQRELTNAKSSTISVNGNAFILSSAQVCN